jgi:nucleoside-diphosphate-sugar epimerase
VCPPTGPVGTIPDPHATEGGDLVGAERRPVRSRRSGPGAARTVAVTGAANGAGAAIVEALLRRVGTEGGPAAVIAVVAERGRADGVSWRLGDLESSSDLLRCLAGVTTVVHVAAPTDLAADLLLTPTRRRARAVRAVQEVCAAAAAVGAHRLLVVTSAMVYGARADNPVPLPDDAPLRAEPDEGVIGDLLEVERILHRSPRVHPELRITVLRPAALVGPGVDTLVTRHFEAPRLLSLRGGVMRWQFLHTEDLGTAVAVAVEHDLDGVLTAGSTDWLSADQVERSAGMRRVELPPALAYGTAERLHRARVLPSPAADLALVVHPWVIGSQRLTAAGWQPEYGADACLARLLDQVRGRHAVAGVRVERREAALGAAGAAVAIVGTAALLRQARARRAGRRRPTL